MWRYAAEVLALLVMGSILGWVGVRLCRTSLALRYGWARFALAVVGWVVLMVGGMGSILLGVSYSTFILTGWAL